MRQVSTVVEVRRLVGAVKRGARVGFVPTMGALHAGHATLCHAARDACDFVVASVFVNPSQFNDPADLAAYPRTVERDAEIAAGAGVDVLFSPTAEEIYPAGFSTSVDAEGAAMGWEGDHRPGHFRGVATVCLKLFNIVRPDVAFFGQKDAQQAAVIKQMVRDVNLVLEVRVVPTARDADGVALSSRNARLSPAEREAARAIPRALEAGVAAHARGLDPADAARQRLIAAGLVVDYAGVASFDGQPTLVIAAKAGSTRLIDNVPLDDPARAGIEVREGGARI